jgi:catalase
VIKKSGSIERFNIQKIIEACQSAGLSEEAAKKVAQKVTNELHKVSSSQIREKILKNAKSINPDLAKKIIQYDIRKNKKRDELVQNYTF